MNEQNILDETYKKILNGLINYYQRTKNKFISIADYDQIRREAFGLEKISYTPEDHAYGYNLTVEFDENGKAEFVYIE